MKLLEIKQDPEEWLSFWSNREEEVKVNRLRVGLCVFTHGHLMENKRPRVPLVYLFCSEHIIFVKHILVDCSQLLRHRQIYMPSSCSNINSSSLQNILDKTIKPNEVFSFFQCDWSL